MRDLQTNSEGMIVQGLPFAPKQSLGLKRGITLSTAILIAVFLSALFTSIVVQWSLHSGRLSQDPTYDDVGYLLDGLDRLDVAYEKGLMGFIQSIIQRPPHSLFSTLMATLAFAVAGPHDWAPYAFNGLLILSLLCVIAYLSRGIGLLPLLLMMGFSLSLPVSIIAVNDFRPDYASALAASVGICFAAESLKLPLLLPSRLHLVKIGIAFGIAFIIKPTLIVISMPLFCMALAMISFSHFWALRKRINTARAMGLSYKLALVCIPVLLLAGWYYFIAYRQLYAYFYSNTLGEYSALWKIEGGVLESFRYFTFGPAGKLLLGKSAIGLIAFILIGIMFAFFRKDWEIVLSELFYIVSALVVVSILSLARYANGYFAIFYILILVFASINIISHIAKIPNKVIYTVLNIVILLAIVYNVTVSRSSVVHSVYRSEVSKKGMSINERIIRDIVTAIDSRAHGNVANPSVFVSFVGAVNESSLRWVAKKSRHGLLVKAMNADPSMEKLNRMSKSVDFILLAKGGTPDIWRKVPQVDQINDSMIERLSNDNGFREVARYQTAGEGAIYLFENVYARTGGFTSLGTFRGFLPPEDPVAGSGGRRVRWGLWPDSGVLLKSAEDGKARLLISMRAASRKVRAVEILVNGSHLAMADLIKDGLFQDYQIEMLLMKGINNLDFVYKGEPSVSGDGRKRAVLFSNIQIDDPGRIIRR